MSKKYKPCCENRCLVHGCETKEYGGCYCLCRLKDAENHCIGLLEGTHFRQGGGIIYVPGRMIPLEGPEKISVENELIMIRSKIKAFENENEE